MVESASLAYLPRTAGLPFQTPRLRELYVERNLRLLQEKIILEVEKIILVCVYNACFGNIYEYET